MPKFSPWVKNSVIATIESSAEIGKLMRRKRVKSKCVSSGTIRSDGNQPKQLTTVSTTIRAPQPQKNEMCHERLRIPWNMIQPGPIIFVALSSCEA